MQQRLQFPHLVLGAHGKAGKDSAGRVAHKVGADPPATRIEPQVFAQKGARNPVPGEEEIEVLQVRVAAEDRIETSPCHDLERLAEHALVEFRPIQRAVVPGRFTNAPLAVTRGTSIAGGSTRCSVRL